MVEKKQLLLRQKTIHDAGSIVGGFYLTKSTRYLFITFQLQLSSRTIKQRGEFLMNSFNAESIGYQFTHNLTVSYKIDE